MSEPTSCPNCGRDTWFEDEMCDMCQNELWLATGVRTRNMKEDEGYLTSGTCYVCGSGTGGLTICDICMAEPLPENKDEDGDEDGDEDYDAGYAGYYDDDDYDDDDYEYEISEYEIGYNDGQARGYKDGLDAGVANEREKRLNRRIARFLGKMKEKLWFGKATIILPKDMDDIPF